MDDTGFYMVYSRNAAGKGSHYLYKFGFDLKLQKEINLSSNIGGYADSRSQKVLMLDDKMYQLMYTSFSDKRVFYVQSIDNNLSLNEPKKIAQFVTPGRNPRSSRTFVYTNKDSSYVALIYTIPNKRKENETFVVNVFDKQMDKVWSQQYQFPYESRLLDLQEFRIDENGEVYVLAKRNFADPIEGAVNYEYILFSLQREGELDAFKINSEGKFLRDMKLEFTSAGDVVSAGFYSNVNESGTGGAFYLRLNTKTKSVESSSFKEFDIDFLIHSLTESKANRVKKRAEKGRTRELAHYFIDELIPKPDGSVLMVGEKRHVFSRQTSGGGFIEYYHYDDLVVVSIDPNGELQWTKRIAKRQHSVNDGAIYSSYARMMVGDELTFVFNDNVRNPNSNASLVTAASVGQLGEVRRSALFNGAKAQIKIRPALAYQLNDSEILLFGHKEVRNQRFVIVKFQ
jgi:hypothetical protein